MSRLGTIGHRLYAGEMSFEIVRRRKLWYALSAVILAAAIIGLSVNGLKLGIEFTGGSDYTINKPGLTVSQARSVADKVVGSEGDPIVQSVGSNKIDIQVSKHESKTTTEITDAFAKDLGVSARTINVDQIGPTFGKEISDQALRGLIIFMVLVTIYLAIAFEWRMAVGALVALLHDMVITIGVYALVGFTVSTGTVIGFLTILGYSLYDTVVVFDTVKENTRGIGKQNKRTYSEAANHGLNQTLVRSINTTVVALLPVAALLFIGGGLLGAGTLNDISLALFIGLSAGAYSSICVATPLMAQLKEQQPEMKALAKRVLQHRASSAKAAAEKAAEGPEPDVDEEDSQEDAVPAGFAGQRQQPVNRRGKGRPSGKRR